MTTYGPNTAAVQRVIDQAARLPKFTEENRDAWDAWAAARDAARADARADAWADAQDAARGDAWAAAWAAAWADARSAAWDAARGDIQDAARSAAWDAARSAAWDAARAAATEVVADLITPEQHATLTAPWQVWVDAFGLDGDS